MTKKFIYVNAQGDYEESPGAFEVADHITVSTGAPDAGKPAITSADGKFDPSLIPFEAFTTKYPCRVATVANVNLASAPASIDGVTLAADDRVLVKDQTSALENGIYIFNGAAAAMTRAEDFNDADEVVAGVVTAVEEGTVNFDRMYMVVSNNPLTLGVSSIVWGLVPINTFTGGNGITLSGYEFSVDLLNTDSGLYFAGGGSDELAIEWATDFTIDAADDLAFKASDLASTANGEGAAIVGIEDASAYYAGNNLESVLNELEAQIGGATSSTYNFTENNVLADNDAIYPALNKLDLKWGDLASVNNGEGASLVGVEDAAGYFTGNDVESVLAELYVVATQHDRDTATAGGTIAKGDLLYFSANDTVLKMPISANNYAVGVALNAATIGQDVSYSKWDEVATGVLSGATFGTKYYWSGSALTTTIPSGSGNYVWTCGLAKNGSDLLTSVEFIKKNS